VCLADVYPSRAARRSGGGPSLLLQGGDCAETFDTPDVPGLVQLFHGLAEQSAASGGAVARIAGQFAKPRTVEGKVWRARSSTAAMRWSPIRADAACYPLGGDRARLPDELFTSHEALLLPYEQALVRGLATAVVERVRGIPLAWRAQPAAGRSACRLRCRARQSARGQAGRDRRRRTLPTCGSARSSSAGWRLTLIVRMGPEIGAACPPHAGLRQEGRQPLWVSDPLHGNTERGGARKVRRLDAITREIEDFVAIARSEGVHAGGLHLEMTAEDVAEVSGGLEGEGWTSACDPRLNPRQAEAVVRTFAAALRQRNAA
jgi:3-deoxy-7-phosphoheptulonate synthase